MIALYLVTSSFIVQVLLNITLVKTAIGDLETRQVSTELREDISGMEPGAHTEEG